MTSGIAVVLSSSEASKPARIRIGNEPASPGDEGIAFVAYLQTAMPSKESGQGCAKRTAEGGLALTRFRGMASGVGCGVAFKSATSPIRSSPI
jgi:hypothetical protein